jgi:NAD(P)H-dependent FMN reductase
MAAEGTTRLLVLLGSVTPPGRLLRALQEALDRASTGAGGSGGIETELIDLADVRVSYAGSGDPSELDDDTASVIAAIGAADVVVFATPVYRGSMTGALKNVFDLLPVPTLEGKVVALAVMGASDHHFLGPDRHLRDVLSFFGALVTPVSVYLTGADFPDGVPGERAAQSLDELIQGALSLAAAHAGAGPLGPSPLAARAIRR